MSDITAAVTSQAFQWPIRVYYEDTDSGGVVYHTSYLRFMERARTEWLRSFGFEQDDLRRELGVLFTVRTVRIEYLKPALFNDLLTVSTLAIRHRRVGLRFQQNIQRVQDESDHLCRADIEVVCVDARNLRPRLIPSAIQAELESMNVG